MMLGFAQTVVRQRAVKRTNADGLPVEQRDWDNADEVTLSGLNVQPLGSRESMGSDVRTVISQWLLMNAPGAGDLDLLVGDRVVVDGRVMDLVAEPERWPALSGGIDHVEAILTVTPPGPGAGGDTTSGHIQAAATGAAVGRGWRP